VELGRTCAHPGYRRAVGWSEDVLAASATRRHLDDLVRVWLGVRDRDTSVPPLPDELARAVLRLEEHEHEERDPWGGWPAPASNGPVRKPEIDVWLERVRRDLGAKLEPRWPQGKRFVVCLTHDVDLLSERVTPAQALRHARAGLAPGVARRGDSVLRLARPAVRLARTARSGISLAPSLRETLERSLELEHAHGATASYFFTVPPHEPRSRYDCTYAARDLCVFRGRRQRVADVIRAIAAEGFDVGLHGGYEAGATAGVLSEERATLVAATGLEITTTRQHFLRWDPRWTPRYQEAAGLRADATMGFNFAVGHRAGTSLPFRLFDAQARRALDVVEVPLVAQDGAMLGPDALALDPARAEALLGELFGVTSAVGGVLTLLFHPDKLVRPPWLALYERVLDQAVEQGAWITSLAELNEWWRARETRVLAS
jgi:hypothetical protein